MRYFLIAGEPSGDQHAANLMIRLKELDPAAEFSFIGGNAMQKVAGTPLIHIRELSVMGFTQLIRRISQISKAFKICHQGIKAFKPDLIIPVDFGGFNLRLIRWASSKGFRSVYYITPKIWAWMPCRGKTIARNTVKSLCILPFEPPFLAKYGADSCYTGNPVLGYTLPVIKRDPASLRIKMQLPDQEIIAVLPGSREQEIRSILPIMASVISYFPNFHFVIAACEGFSDAYYLKMVGSRRVTLVRDQTLNLLRIARSALVTSGTATLEAGLLNVPQVVCYQTSTLTYLVAKLMVRVQHISLVNLILGRSSVDELIQGGLNTRNLITSLQRINQEGPERNAILSDYNELRLLLGERDASLEAARIIFSTARKP